MPPALLVLVVFSFPSPSVFCPYSPLIWTTGRRTVCLVELSHLPSSIPSLCCFTSALLHPFPLLLRFYCNFSYSWGRLKGERALLFWISHFITFNSVSFSKTLAESPLTLPDCFLKSVSSALLLAWPPVFCWSLLYLPMCSIRPWPQNRHSQMLLGLEGYTHVQEFLNLVSI